MCRAINLDSYRYWTVKRQTADSSSVDNVEESQFTAVEQNRYDMNNRSQETPFPLYNYQIFLLKHTQILLTWLQQPTFLQVECSSSFYCYDAEGPSFKTAMHLVERRNRLSKIIKKNLFTSSRSLPNSVSKAPIFFLGGGGISGWTQCNLLRLRLRRRYNKNRAKIELRSIADHCACTTA